MKQLFRDIELQRRFDKNGYLVVSLLSEKQVNNLLDLYKHQITDNEVTGLYESSRNKSLETNQLISEGIYREMKAAADNLFLPSKFYGGTFMVKSHSKSDMLALHQDWSVVEEDKFNTIFIWCPLLDVSVDNGGLFVLEGSHKYFEVLRSGTYPSNRYYLPPALHRYTKEIPLKAGEAILYSDQLFHGSHANNTTRDRIVVTARVMEEDACLVYYQKAGEEKADVYEVDSAFYLKHIDSIAKGQMPVNIPKLYTRPYKHTVITDDALRAKILEHYSTSEKNAGMHCQLFKDPSLQSEFEKNGYVVLDLIGQQQVQELREFYNGLQNAPVPGHGFQVSLDNKDPQFVRSVSEKLISTVKPDVDRYFENHRIFTASFVVKETNPMGVVPPHQDWTFVDESKYWSATLWCPIVDVNMNNGGLGVIKGSHLFYDHVRPSPSPQYEPPFKDQLAVIFPYLKIIELKAGQALVFNNQTIHGSPPNTSGESRISFGIGITHKDAPIKHFYKLPNQQKQHIEGFDVVPEFFYEYNNARLSAMYNKGEKPQELNSIGVFENIAKRYTDQELVEKILAAGNEKDDRVIQKMAAIYGYDLMVSEKVVNKQEDSGKKQSLPFWKVYTPGNVYREIKYRLTKK